MRRVYSLFRLSPSHFLEEVYRLLLTRETDQEGYFTYSNLLKDGWSYSFIIHAITQSPEYEKCSDASTLRLNLFIQTYKLAQRKSIVGWFARNIYMAESDFLRDRMLRKVARKDEFVNFSNAFINEQEILSNYWQTLYNDLFTRSRFLYYKIAGQIVKESASSFSKKIEQLNSPFSDYKVIQFWDSKLIPSDVLAYMDKWAELYQGRYLRFDDLDAESFIRENYPEDFVMAYKACWHPAMKSDFFRLCYLYTNGGCYVDADELPLAPLPNIDLESSQFIILKPYIRIKDGDKLKNLRVTEYLEKYDVYREAEVYFNNAPIIVSSKNPIISSALLRAKSIILSDEKYKMSIHDITGPTNLSLSILVHFFFFGIRGAKPVNVISINWERYARIGSANELTYKNDDRDWRKKSRLDKKI
jgi:hypothetical protein